MLPAAFMTLVVTSYICMEKLGFQLPYGTSVIIGLALAVLFTVMFYRKRIRDSKL